MLAAPGERAFVRHKSVAYMRVLAADLLGLFDGGLVKQDERVAEADLARRIAVLGLGCGLARRLLFEKAPS